jgi:epoxyqueuosine reductase
MRIKHQARAIGFEMAGIAPAAQADGFDMMQNWLNEGMAGEMTYMARHAEARRHPASILSEVRSVVMVGMNYFTGPEAAQAVTAHVGLRGRVALYARGDDYHKVLRSRLKNLLRWIQAESPGCHGRAVVDTAPLLERDFARRAGLGWFGKNTILINKRLGSYFFIGALLLSLELEADAAHDSSHCGTCTACLDACPTGALVAPGRLDARRCISYLTIELKSSVATELRAGVGEWIFGCDVCQEVCPWNAKAPASTESAWGTRPDLLEINVGELLGLTESDFRQRFHGTALMRAGRGALLRNAALVLGNRGDPAGLPALRAALADRDPLVAEAAEWAIDQITRRHPMELAR